MVPKSEEMWMAEIEQGAHSWSGVRCRGGKIDSITDRGDFFVADWISREEMAEE
jgi:hypothetical protein